MRIKCWNCESVFDEEEIRIQEMSAAAYYGIDDFALAHTRVTVHSCPFCDSEDNMEEYYEESESEED